MQCISDGATSGAAVFYCGKDGLPSDVPPFVLDGLATGDWVRIAFPARNLELLRNVGHLADEVELEDVGSQCGDAQSTSTARSAMTDTSTTRPPDLICTPMRANHHPGAFRADPDA